jgi:hypothetical protein
MSRYDQLAAELIEVKARLAALENRPRSKRVAAPRPDNAVVRESRALWDAYVDAEVERGIKRVTKCGFAARHKIPQSEFYRLFSYRDKKGIPPGSGPFRRMRAEVIDATDKLKDSHGKLDASQVFSMKTAV